LLLAGKQAHAGGLDPPERAAAVDEQVHPALRAQGRLIVIRVAEDR